MADQQLGAKFLLELLDLVGDVGLADVQFARGTAKIPRASDAVKIAQFPQLECPAAQ